jgi:hypothetical protein
VQVFPGNNSDPAALTEVVTVAPDRLRVARRMMVGDRGITYTDENPPSPENPVTPGRPGRSYGPTRLGWPALSQLSRPARLPGHPRPQPGAFRRSPANIPVFAEPTPPAGRPFDLISAKSHSP